MNFNDLLNNDNSEKNKKQGVISILITDMKTLSRCMNWKVN